VGDDDLRDLYKPGQSAEELINIIVTSEESDKMEGGIAKIRRADRPRKEELDFSKPVRKNIRFRELKKTKQRMRETGNK